MARDYAALVASLRRKAADPVVPDTERRALLERASEIEKNHPEAVTESSPFIDDTTVTGRDGRMPWQYDENGHFNPFARPPGYEERVYHDYFHQNPWGGKSYYATDARTRFTKPNPKPGEDPEFDKKTREAWDELWNLHRSQAAWNPPDADDLYEENYKYADDEDYGYDIYEGEEYE